MLVPYQEIQALGFPNSPRKLGLYEKPWACISWYGPCTQLVNSKYSEKILKSEKKKALDVMVMEKKINKLRTNVHSQLTV